MKLGICLPPEYWVRIKNAGYSYVEWNFSVIAGSDREGFYRTLSKRSEAKIDSECFNGFFPGDMPLYTVSDGQISDYARRGFEKAALLGGSLAVLGAGGARRIPEGMETARAEERFVQILRILGREAERVGMSVGIEPLCKRETNFINNIDQAVSLARMADMKNVGVICDLYHHAIENESRESVINAGEMILHAHLATPDDRRAVPNEEDIEACLDFARLLKSAGYKGNRISLECRYGRDINSEIDLGARLAPLLEEI